MSDALSRAEQIRLERKERGSEELAGVNTRLPHVKKEAGWTYRHVNDEGDNVYKRNEMGWEVVADRGGKTASLGTQVSAYAGQKTNGDALKTTLMRLPTEIHEDDKRAKARAIDATEAGMKSGAVPGASAGEMYGPGLKELP